jgi:hypothetical protein
LLTKRGRYEEGDGLVNDSSDSEPGDEADEDSNGKFIQPSLNCVSNKRQMKTISRMTTLMKMTMMTTSQ